MFELAVVFGQGVTVAGRPRALIPTVQVTGLVALVYLCAFGLGVKCMFLRLVMMVVPLEHVDSARVGDVVRARWTTRNSDRVRGMLLTANLVPKIPRW